MLPRVLALTLIVLQDVGCEAALVPHVGGILPILGLDDTLEVVVDLGADTHGFPEGAGSHGQDHELLHGQLVPGVGAPIDDIEGLAGGEREWAQTPRPQAWANREGLGGTLASQIAHRTV